MTSLGAQTTGNTNENEHCDSTHYVCLPITLLLMVRSRPILCASVFLVLVVYRFLRSGGGGCARL